MSRLLAAAAVLLVAWGALAFGAVYSWAYLPLLVGCALVGALGTFAVRHAVISRAMRQFSLALLAVIAAASIQLLPLPQSVLRTVSPGADRFLQTYDLSYSWGGSASADAGAAAPRHPLSIAPRRTATGLALLAGLTLFLVGTTRALSRANVRAVAYALVGFGALLAVIGIGQKAMLGDHAYGGMLIYGFWAPENNLSTPFGPYVNKNHFAGWMLMAIPLSIGLGLGAATEAQRQFRRGGWRGALLWLSSPDGGRVQLVLLGVALMAASLLMTRSRSGVACFIVSIVMFSAAAGRRARSAKVGLIALGALGTLFLTVFALAGHDFAARIVNRMDAMELRKNIWTDSARIIRDFPVAGTGLNTFGTAMIGYQTSQMDQHFQEAHNDYLQLLVEGGVLIAIPVVIALFFLLRAVRERFASRDDDPQMYWLRAGAVIGLLTIGVQAFVEFSLQMPGNAVLFVVLLAIALHEPVHRRISSARPRSDLIGVAHGVGAVGTQMTTEKRRGR
jgi:O-antigen ligase